MRKLFLVGFAAVCTLLLVGSAFAQMHSYGAISGTVADQANGQPLVMANVQAFSPDSPNRPMGWAITDQAGHYAIRLPAGNFKVMAAKVGYQPEWWQEVATPDQATVIAVADSQVVENINFTLAFGSPPPPPHGTISGIVNDQVTTAPIFRAMVKAYGPDNIMFSAQSDSLGVYTINLPLGTYSVRAEKMGYLPEWWQEVPERNQATPVQVAQDQNATGINFTLSVQTPPQVGSIAGVITNATTSEPLSRAMVQVASMGNHPMHIMVMTGQDGAYIANNLQTGYYRVEAFKEGFLPNHYPDSVYVNGAPVTGINIALTPIIMGTINGVVTNAANGDPIARASVCASAIGDPRAHMYAMTDSSGAYSMTVPVGLYHMEAHARDFAPANVDSVLVGDLLPTTVNFALNALTFGSIAGNVYDTLNVPIWGAWVEARLIRGNWRGHVRTDSSGHYMLEHVITGNYIVTAHANRFQPAVYPDTVEVADGQAVTGIDFHLLPFVAPSGTISGLVTNDSTGLPIADGMVIAFAGNAIGYRCHATRITRTLADGTYLLERLLPVPYKVMCFARGYNGEFYNNKLTWQEADPVTPNAVDINFGLTPRTNPGPRFLSGRILENGNPVTGAIVTALLDGQPVEVTGTYPDGSYEFADIDPGNYTLSVVTDEESQGQAIVNILFNDIYANDITVISTGIDNEINLPTSTTLMQNYPNPFNSSTNISFYLANESRVELSIYDLLGRKVTTLISGNLQAGQQTINWNGINARGSQVASGMYLYILKTDGGTQSKRMVMLK
jgi:hypothetical protein